LPLTGAGVYCKELGGTRAPRTGLDPILQRRYRSRLRAAALHPGVHTPLRNHATQREIERWPPNGCGMRRWWWRSGQWQVAAACATNAATQRPWSSPPVDVSQRRVASRWRRRRHNAPARRERYRFRKCRRGRRISEAGTSLHPSKATLTPRFSARDADRTNGANRLHSASVFAGPAPG
jgi:hypothetical protein